MHKVAQEETINNEGKKNQRGNRRQSRKTSQRSGRRTDSVTNSLCLSPATVCETLARESKKAARQSGWLWRPLSDNRLTI
ncbi:hypothetical protein RRG08_005441 [Elysia crispata]|uniref:Uncharacterized protein n=1 Tax=Elysia crispata TaxID=231223 RepID=A0AAE1CQV0_9GAST|nr:hypothetical protein RRG08_005441 [Elysia crispata]